MTSRETQEIKAAIARIEQRLDSLSEDVQIVQGNLEIACEQIEERHKHEVAARLAELEREVTPIRREREFRAEVDRHWNERRLSLKGAPLPEGSTLLDG